MEKLLDGLSFFRVVSIFQLSQTKTFGNCQTPLTKCHFETETAKLGGVSGSNIDLMADISFILSFLSHFIGNIHFVNGFIGMHKFWVCLRKKCF